MPAETSSSAVTTLIERVILEVSAAINMRGLYGASHPRAAEAVTKIKSALDALGNQRGGDVVTFLIVGDDLVADQQPLRKGSVYQRQFVQALKRRGVERLTISRDLTPEECQELIESFVGEGVPHSTAHAIVGKIEVGVHDQDVMDGPREKSRPSAALSASKIDAVRESFVRMRNDLSGGLGSMQEMIWSFIDALSRSTREILPLAPLKDHDEYTFVHSINVSLLVLAQARSFGIKGDQLQKIGLAALMHDIGKLAVPLSVLNKKGKLEGEEWRLMTSHADMGALRLSEIQQTDPLAVLVAYEHHLRWDGVPNYPLLSTPRRANMVSQMTSIADTYDAIATNRPYQESRSQKLSLEIVEKRAGTFLDPFLVGNFIQLVRRSDAPS